MICAQCGSDWYSLGMQRLAQLPGLSTFYELLVAVKMPMKVCLLFTENTARDSSEKVNNCLLSTDFCKIVKTRLLPCDNTNASPEKAGGNCPQKELKNPKWFNNVFYTSNQEE